MKYLLIAFLFIGGCTQSKIQEWPISFGEQRIQMTIDYMNDHYGIVQEHPNINPKMVVVHWTHIPTLEESFEAFDPETLPGKRSDIASAGNLNVSSHFLVDRDGIIYRLMPETYMARHVIGLNHCAIGIENVGGNKGYPLTEMQLKSNVWLVNYLQDMYPVEHVIGHYEYQDFEDTEFWLEKDEGYRTEKEDPGAEFMMRLRESI